jgi:uncharacterized RDD family membrane protein YckC
LAGWWRRFGSGVADTAITWVLTLTLVVVTAPSFLNRLWSQYLAYAEQIATALSTPGAALPLPDVAWQQQYSTLLLVAGGVTIVYCATFLGTWGATLGQRLCGIKVVKAPPPPALIKAGATPFVEEKPGWVRAISKSLSWSLFSFGGQLFLLVQLLNALMPLWHRRKQSVTDLFANTLVVRATPAPRM